MGLLSERAPFQAFPDRPRMHLPGDARVAVWIIVNVEEWSIARTMPRTVLPPPMGQPLMPDLPNWAWHEYGMRVGFWRILKALETRGLRVTFAVNGHVCRSYERVARAAHDAGWEFMGHGYLQRPMHQLEDQRAAIVDTVETIRAFTGGPPPGWESPGLTENEQTLDLLKEAGIGYVADWVIDDLPFELATAHGPMLSVPYSVETNDIVVHAVQHQPSDAFRRRCLDQFDRLWEEGAENAHVMAISTHPYLTGVPHRIAHFEALLDDVLGRGGVAMMTGEEIADWYRAEKARIDGEPAR
ncbi:polysaccharide deacetylase family protein [Ancylobacter mangrovi]|uniref:polysaccharide deacetylase family protein n=1 Tax=Ancylobacter mangrovi TaxID=2972472 RepID=UPI0021628CB2|nr:polysaccharide deacetylase family protein [Ancylobacter mangrovi]MCS0504273.1 polysaccharide deacetylase family protein [Ancylobacter mangrovi]